METQNRGLCQRRNEGRDPAALSFSMTHNINHFIQVGHMLLRDISKPRADTRWWQSSKHENAPGDGPLVEISEEVKARVQLINKLNKLKLLKVVYMKGRQSKRFSPNKTNYLHLCKSTYLS